MNTELKSQKQNEKVYLNIYSINAKKPLWTQLAVVLSGAGFKNVLYLLKQVVQSEKVDVRKLCYRDLSASELNKLDSLIEKQEFEIPIKNRKNAIYYANCKNRKYTTAFASELNLDVVDQDEQHKNTILLNNSLKSDKKLHIQRLVKMNCYVGTRHFKKYKVHGQSTKSTGRKNKIARGFIKKKQQKKLERTTARAKDNTN